MAGTTRLGLPEDATQHAAAAAATLRDAVDPAPSAADGGTDEAPRRITTLRGHDQHAGALDADGGATATAPAADAGATAMAPAADGATAATAAPEAPRTTAGTRTDPEVRPGSSGKSGFPAVAGVFGRRDEDGNLVPLSSPALDRQDVPGGRRWLNAILVVAAALLGFAVVAALGRR